ncbi:hypothetical protein B8V81_2517 [Paenibacillus pasadenensis]|uniref:Uncharacterized protein n=1 Tax=Paenibacillus pasadenensis TaxID=217090 RepID=A0A2N5N192_9BACL|nr:hypothetical protein B8V81_2517 [Paenibacillus pasadenensis]
MEGSWRSGSGSLEGQIPSVSGREIRGIWASAESEGVSILGAAFADVPP